MTWKSPFPPEELHGEVDHDLEKGFGRHLLNNFEVKGHHPDPRNGLWGPVGFLPLVKSRVSHEARLLSPELSQWMDSLSSRTPRTREREVANTAKRKCP